MCVCVCVCVCVEGAGVFLSRPPKASDLGGPGTSWEVESRPLLRMDEIHFAPPKKPGKESIPLQIQTDNHFIMVSKKCRILSIHSITSKAPSVLLVEAFLRTRMRRHSNGLRLSRIFGAHEEARRALSFRLRFPVRESSRVGCVCVCVCVCLSVCLFVCVWGVLLFLR